MKKEANLERFRVVVRPYLDAYGNNGYACVIPFNNKEDCLNFVRITNLTIIGIDDETPPDAPLSTAGEDTVKNLLPIVMDKLKESKEDEKL